MVGRDVARSGVGGREMSEVNEDGPENYLAKRRLLEMIKHGVIHFFLVHGSMSLTFVLLSAKMR